MYKTRASSQSDTTENQHINNKKKIYESKLKRGLPL